MLNAKALLDTVMGGIGQMTGGKGAAGLTDKAKAAWDSQSTLGKGAIAGGLLGILMTQGGRRLLGTGARIGGAALIGGLAYQAYADWKAGKKSGAPFDPDAATDPDFLPDHPEAADDLATRILQAMIAAAKADGHVTEAERARIDAQLASLGLGDDAAALIGAELDTPLDVARIAALARSEQEAAELYAASLLVLDDGAAGAADYLAALASALGLDADLVAHLHAKAA